MIYINKDITDTLETIELSIPISVSKFYSPLNFTLFNAQSKEILHITDLNNYSCSEYFVSIRIDPESINELKGYYSYVLKSNNNNIVACGLLVIEGENAVNTVYNNDIRNVVYNG